jgi:hypothetical protein
MKRLRTGAISGVLLAVAIATAIFAELDRPGRAVSLIRSASDDVRTGPSDRFPRVSEGHGLAD